MTEAEDIDVLARTLYGEARGESRAGRVAVANVVINRALRGGWWGETVAEVCRKKWQFSCWNKGDPNRAIVKKVKVRGNPLFRECIEIATQAVRLKLPDSTFGSYWYHARGVSPEWAFGHAPVCSIGGHDFYDSID